MPYDPTSGIRATFFKTILPREKKMAEEQAAVRSLNNLLGKLNIEGYTGGKVPMFDGTEYTF